MSSSYGENFRLTIFGQSHSPAIGVTMEDGTGTFTNSSHTDNNVPENFFSDNENYVVRTSSSRNNRKHISQLCL